jgi:hypothetical protein
MDAIAACHDALSSAAPPPASWVVFMIVTVLLAKTGEERS